MKSVNQFLDGLLLGDGHIQKCLKDKNARYCHSCKEKEYIEFVFKTLDQFGITSNCSIYVKPNGYGTGVTYQSYTHVNKLLTSEHKRWYPNNIKLVPPDLILTSESIKHWYIGDGGFDSDKGYLRQIQIAAHSFTYDERDFLVQQLINIGFKASNRKKGLICISKNSIPDFLNFIGECPVICYQYKWDTSRFTFKQPKY